MKVYVESRMGRIGRGAENEKDGELEVAMEYKDLEQELMTKLTRIIQRFEREGVDLTIEDIRTVRRAKCYLGYSTPETLDQGTGGIVEV